MSNKTIKISFFQIIVFLLSIYIVIIMILQLFVNFSPEMEKLLWTIDTGICFIFIIDFFIETVEDIYNLSDDLTLSLSNYLNN